MVAIFILILWTTFLFAKELKIQEAIDLALKNSPIIKASQRDVKAQELELKAAKGALFPRIKLEETYTRTDVPAYAFMSKLNQERITKKKVCVSLMACVYGLYPFKPCLVQFCLCIQNIHHSGKAVFIP